MSAPVRVAFNEDRTRAAFTLFHPKGNIVTLDMVYALRRGLESIGENPHLKLITLEGAGADFSFGASIPEHAPEQIGIVLPEMHRLIDDLLEAPAVTAAVVRGRCFGGGLELALACDFIFAEDDASFALPEVALGVFPPAASALLPMRVGYAVATAAIVTGETLDASRWSSRHLVDVVANKGQIAAVVDDFFSRHLEKKSASALRYAAAAARFGLIAHVRNVLPQLERLYLNDLMRTQDAVEGIAAFLHKRPPDWKNR